MRFTTETLSCWDERDQLCHFGIEEVVLGTTLAEVLGGGTFGAVAAGGLEGAALGAGSSLITGQNPLTGALTGGLTGGVIGGAGPAIGDALGVGTTAGDAIAGGLGGAAGSLITGQNPLTGALTGAGGGLVAGLSGGSTSAGAPTTSSSVSGAPTTGTAGGTSAAAAAPAAITPPTTGGPSVDLTNPVSSSLGIDSAAGGTGSTVGPSGVPSSTIATGDFSPRPPSSGFDIGSFISKNPGVLLGAGALGANMLFGGSQPSAAEGRLQNQANELNQQARAFTAPMFSGTLPPGMQQMIDRQTSAAEAQIKSRFAAAGLSGSTMEAQYVAAAKQEAAGQAATLAENLAKQGIALEQLSSSDLEALMRAQQLRDQQFTQALTSFASGLAGAKFNTGGSSGASGA